MFMHNRKLQYTVRVRECNPQLATLMLEQFGGPQGKLAEGMVELAEMRHLTGNSSSQTRSILYGNGTALVNSSGVPWSAAHVDTIGEPTADLRSNIAAEARAKMVYERLIAMTDDPGIRDALTFLTTREVAHPKAFEKALCAITPNFPPGRLPGDPAYTGVHDDMSHGEDVDGPWNSGALWTRVSERDGQMAVDGGNGSASVTLAQTEADALAAFAARTVSATGDDPVTGAGPGAGAGKVGL